MGQQPKPALQSSQVSVPGVTCTHGHRHCTVTQSTGMVQLLTVYRYGTVTYSLQACYSHLQSTSTVQSLSLQARYSYLQCTGTIQSPTVYRHSTVTHGLHTGHSHLQCTGIVQSPTVFRHNSHGGSCSHILTVVSHTEKTASCAPGCCGYTHGTRFLL